MVKNYPLIIAHRGASAVAPENTLAAFGKALEVGADGIEFDVRLAKDGVPIVFHDSTLSRMAQRKIRTSNYTSAELQSLDIGAWFNAEYPKKAAREFIGASIPTLVQLFDFLRGYPGRIYVELKGKIEEIFPLLESVAKIIRQTDFLPQIVLKSFKLQAVAQAAKVFPEVCTAALFAPNLSSIVRSQDRLIEQARKCSADELSLHYSLATQKFVGKAANENLPVTIWTADHPSWVRKAAANKIKAIITNNPAKLLKEKAQLPPDI